MGGCIQDPKVDPPGTTFENFHKLIKQGNTNFVDFQISNLMSRY